MLCNERNAEELRSRKALDEYIFALLEHMGSALEKAGGDLAASHKAMRRLYTERRH